MKHLFSCLKAYRKEAILAPFFKLLEACMELTVPLVVAAIINTGLAGEDRGYLINACLLLVAFGALGLLFALTAQYFAAIAAVVVGGTSMSGGSGRLGGTLIGALIIGILTNGLNLMGVNSDWQYIIKGAVILLAVYVDFLRSNKKAK